MECEIPVSFKPTAHYFLFIMEITIVPASSSVGHATIRKLLASPSQPTIRAIYRNVDKAPEEFRKNSRFAAVRGDVGSGELSFGSSEAVLYVPPMVVDGSDTDEFAIRAANNVKQAIERAKTVKRLISQSALASQFDGVVSTNQPCYIRAMLTWIVYTTGDLAHQLYHRQCASRRGSSDVHHPPVHLL
jgi:hypothetical protein